MFSIFEEQHRVCDVCAFITVMCVSLSVFFVTLYLLGGLLKGASI
jgi:hypothetical protein